MKKLSCILLVDDNLDDNFFHERVIWKAGAAERVISTNSGDEALTHLRESGDTKPDLIFLDINMPGMNGWEFLKALHELEPPNQKTRVVFLTTSENPDDKMKAAALNAGFKTKPLTKEMLVEIIEQYFSD